MDPPKKQIEQEEISIEAGKKSRETLQGQKCL
jgi:hypothetical protein